MLTEMTQNLGYLAYPGLSKPLLRVIQLRSAVLVGKYKYLLMELIQTFLQIESVETNAFKLIPIGRERSSLVDFV